MRLRAQHIYNVNIPGCATAGKVFVGQRKEPFYIAVGKIFDLFNLNPLGPEVDGNNNDLEAKNVSTLALELPISCITNGTRAGDRRLHDGEPAPGPPHQSVARRPASTSVGQEAAPGRRSRGVGMPLVNEVVIGIDDKDRFNASKPKDDAVNFPDYVTNPVLPTLIQTLFPTVTAPTNFPRTDLLTVFLTRPEDAQPAGQRRAGRDDAAQHVDRAGGHRRAEPARRRCR